MRNALVVLVLSCIGLSSGFIVPSGVLELFDETKAVIANNVVRESEEYKRKLLPDDINLVVFPYKTKDSKIADLETKQNSINDNELYEQNTNKENNVNERSFIYINQKYKTPTLNHLHNSVDLFQDTFRSVMNKNRNFNKYPEHYPLAYNQTYFTSKIQQMELGQPFNLPVSHNNGEDAGHLTINKEYINKPVLKMAKNEVPKEYVEFSKSPLVRPIIQNEKIPQTNNANKDNAQSNQDIKYTTGNKYMFIPSYPPKPRLPSVPEYQVFRSPFEQRSHTAFNYGIPVKSNTNNNIKKLLHDNNEMSKVLETYLKDNFGKLIIYDRFKENTKCNYNDCIMTPTKHHNINCRCGRRMNLNLRESNNFEPNTMRYMEVIEKQSTEKSSELNDYADLLNETANLKSLLEE